MTTFKVHGKMQTLTVSQPKTTEPIVTKFEWREYVVDAYHKKNLGSIRPGVFAPHIGEMYTSPVRNLLHFFWFFNSPTGESVRPIFTLNTSNNAVLCKEVLFYCYRKIYFSLIYSKNSKKLQWRLWEKFLNSLNCHNFSCVQDRVVIFGSRTWFLEMA